MRGEWDWFLGDSLRNPPAYSVRIFGWERVVPCSWRLSKSGCNILLLIISQNIQFIVIIYLY